MQPKIVLSLYDYTGEMVRPWAENGYECHILDIQHAPLQNNVEHFGGGGSIHKIHADLHDDLYNWMNIYASLAHNVQIVFGFPVCTDLAVSGAAHFAKKAKVDPLFQRKAATHAKNVATFAKLLGVPYMVENPVSVLSTLWRKPDFYFHPYEYGGYIPEDQAEHPTYPTYIAPRDAYSKKTSIWSGNGFVQPDPLPVPCESYGNSTQHAKLGGKSDKTKNIRSATPRGFARAVYESNKG